MLFSRAAIRLRSQPRASAAISVVELLAMGFDALHQLAGERRGVVEGLVGRPAGHLLLIEREDCGAALVGATHDGRRRPQARETYSPVRVSTRTRSPSLTNSGTSTRTPDSSVAGLVPPPDAVSPLTPG